MRHSRQWIHLTLLIAVLFTSCSSPAATPTATQAPQPSATAALPTVEVKKTTVPDVVITVGVFLQAWQNERYDIMHGMLSADSQAAFPLEKFQESYRNFATNLTLDTFDFQTAASVMNPTNAEVRFGLVYHTNLVGDLNAEITMPLALEGGEWKVVWNEGLIYPQLAGGNTLQITLGSAERSDIFDQHGSPLVVNSDIVSLGLIKGQTNPNQESTLVSVMASLTGKPRSWIWAVLNDEDIYDGVYVPLGEALLDDVHDEIETLTALDGVVWQEYQGRFYFGQGIAPHVTGYVASVPQGEEDTYRRLGFSVSDRVGQNGIEYWGQSYLIGQRSVDLRVVDPQGNTVAVVKQVEAQPAQSISLTIDRDLQLQAQYAINGYTGAIVVMERDTGRVLAMVSSPGFDPNAFECGEGGVNYQHCMALIQTINDGQNRSYNRATGNGYPLGSVFKVITMAAALESGLVQPEDTLDCQYEYWIDGTVLYDWTRRKEYPPSGVLNLSEGLMRSCNPWFYHIGELLFKAGRPNDISNMARSFGLGSKTGIEVIPEEAGNVPEPTDPVEAARIAIGQNTVLVNPLQVARFIAAVGNGGTLYRPQLIESIAGADGSASFTFQPEAQGALPVSEEHLRLIQTAMRSVVASPRGTAEDIFRGLGYPLYGKTGTAEVDFNDPNAWFAGYTNVGNPARPDIAFAVIIENAGEGSEIAAPIARRLVEVYFTGKPQRIYPWESAINATATPPPEGEGTPAP